MVNNKFSVKNYNKYAVMDINFLYGVKKIEINLFFSLTSREKICSKLKFCYKKVGFRIVVFLLVSVSLVK